MCHRRAGVRRYKGKGTEQGRRKTWVPFWVRFWGEKSASQGEGMVMVAENSSNLRVSSPMHNEYVKKNCFGEVGLHLCFARYLGMYMTRHTPVYTTYTVAAYFLCTILVVQMQKC
jgi:hypothetical protein